MEGFEQLAMNYQQMIYRIIHSLHIYKNFDEFYQVGLIALWDASKSYNQTKGDFTSYAYKFIKGRMLSELTKAASYEEHILYPKEQYWTMLEDHAGDRTCELELLLSYFNGLTENQKKWVLLTYVEDLSVADIAAREAVSISAVKQWRKGAMTKLTTGQRSQKK